MSKVPAASLEIGFVVPGPFARRTGGNLYDQRMIHELEERGHRVSVVEVVGFAERTWWQNLECGLEPDTLRALESPVDVWIEDELLHPVLWRSRLPGQEAQPGAAPRFALVHHLRCHEAHPAVEKRAARVVESAYLCSVGGWLCNSQHSLRSVWHLVGNNHEDSEHLFRGVWHPEGSGMARPAVVVYPGRDRLDSRIKRAEVIRRCRSGGPLRVVFVGNLMARKNLELLIRAVAGREDVVLRVVGEDSDPEYAESCRELAACCGERVSFLGAVSDDELRQVLRDSDVMAVVSHLEGFGMVYLEALAEGLPVLAGRHGGAGELIEEGKCGYLFEPDDEVGVVEALGRFGDDREELERVSLEAWDHWVGWPSWSEGAAAVEAFVRQQVIAAHG